MFNELLKMIPGIEDRIMTSNDDEVYVVAELVSFVFVLLNSQINY